MSRSKWPRSWDERVPDIDEVDTNDLVALTKAKSQWVRDRAIDREEIKILRERLKTCVRREGVNHPMACREYKEAYNNAVAVYKIKSSRKMPRKEIS